MECQGKISYQSHQRNYDYDMKENHFNCYLFKAVKTLYNDLQDDDCKSEQWKTKACSHLSPILLQPSSFCFVPFLFQWLCRGQKGRCLKTDCTLSSSQHACPLSWREQVIHIASHILLNPQKHGEIKSKTEVVLSITRKDQLLHCKIKLPVISSYTELVTDVAFLLEALYILNTFL